MKKVLKVFVLIILIILIALLAAPVVFKGKIISVANEQLEKNLNAKASFSDLNLSFFRNFPNLGIRLKGLKVVGKDEFEGDTLLSVNSFDIAVDVISAIKMENIEIKKIIINQPHINAIVLENGKANWDIVPESEEENSEEEDTTSSDFTANIALKLFSINNGNISYSDQSSNMSASLENFNFALSGDLSQDFSKLVIDSETEKLNFSMGNIRYLKNILLKLHFDVDANLKESVYKLNENSVALNALSLLFDGSIEMPESGDIITDLRFETSNTDFKTLLSLVPAIYLTDFEDLKTTGKLKLEGVVKGAVTETATPNADIKLLVKNATFSYPDLPKSAKDITIDVDVHYDGVQMDNTTVDVNTFHVNLGGNPLDLELNLRTPISDPFTNGKLSAKLDLETILDIIPLEDTKLTGEIDAHLDWMGKYSSIEKEHYEEFKADGSIKINQLSYTSPDVPKTFRLNKAGIQFSPRFLQISEFDARMGASDFKLSGSVSNYIAYILKDETVKGELVLDARKLDLNELLASSEEEEEVTPEDGESAPLEVVEVPSNIYFRFNSTIDKLFYDDMVIEDMIGIIYLKEGRLLMENLSMNALEGSLKISGEYNTQDIKNPLVNMTINANEIDIPLAVETFEVLGKISPIAKNASGKVTIGLSFYSLLMPDMKPVMNSISGDGRLASDRIGIKNSDAFTAIGDALKTDALNDMVLKDVDLSFEIQNGTLHIDPFDTKMGDATMVIGGEHTFENTMNYNIDLSAPRTLLGLENPTVNNLFDKAASKGLDLPKKENVDIKIKVTGELKNPKVSLDLKETAANTIEDVKEEVKETVKEVVKEKTEEIKEDTKEKARAEADKIMKEAERQGDIVRKEAKKAADGVRFEANKNANKLVEEATNPIAKKAAEVGAKKIRQEGEAKAKKIENEADAKANKILQEAQKKSDDLLK